MIIKGCNVLSPPHIQEQIASNLLAPLILQNKNNRLLSRKKIQPETRKLLGFQSLRKKKKRKNEYLIMREEDKTIEGRTGNISFDFSAGPVLSWSCPCCIRTALLYKTKTLRKSFYHTNIRLSLSLLYFNFRRVSDSELNFQLHLTFWI